MRVFCTVGSTKFDLLISQVLSPAVQSALRVKGYDELTVQHGHSQISTTWQSLQDMKVELWSFKPSLEEEFKRADLVISHAGSGTILEVLRLGKPLIVIPNDTLADNHQLELAKALADLGHLKTCNVTGLAEMIAAFDAASLVPFPAFDPTRFESIMNQEMGVAP